LSTLDEIFHIGDAPVTKHLWVAVRNFNSTNQESPVSNDKVEVMALTIGDLVIETIPPNSGGWLEGYRGNDPKCKCGLVHVSALKQIYFR